MVPTNTSESLVKRFMVKPKLLKMTLPRFSGKITEFRGFWARFKTAVHNNQSLLTVDKFTYLHGKEWRHKAYKVWHLHTTRQRRKL